MKSLPDLPPGTGPDHIDPTLVANSDRYSIYEIGAAIGAQEIGERCRALDHVLLGRLLYDVREKGRYLEHPIGRQEGQQGQQGFYLWAKQVCGKGKQQVDNCIKVRELELDLVKGRKLSFKDLLILLKTHPLLRPRVADLADLAGRDKPLVAEKTLRAAAKVATSTLQEGLGDLAAAEAQLLAIAKDRRVLPGRGKRKDIKKVRRLIKALDAELEMLTPEERARELAVLGIRTERRGQQRGAGPENSAAAENPPKPSKTEDLAGAAGAAPPPAKDPPPPEEQDRPVVQGPGPEESSLAPPDWHLPVLAAIRAGLDEDAAQELACQLCDIARGVDPSIYAQGLRDLWQRCGLEAAGVDRGHFDFYIGELVGPDWSTRGLFALGFLRLGTLPNYALLIHMLRAAQLPDDLRAEVWQAGDEVPEEDMFDVPRTGPGPATDLGLEIGIVLRWVDRMLPEVPKAAPVVQRDLCHAASELYMVLCEILGPPPPEELQPRPMRF